MLGLQMFICLLVVFILL